MTLRVLAIVCSSAWIPAVVLRKVWHGSPGIRVKGTGHPVMSPWTLPVKEKGLVKGKEFY